MDGLKPLGLPAGYSGMAIPTTLSAMFFSRVWLCRLIIFTSITGLTISLLACSKSSQPGVGSSKKLQISIGEIKEIEIPGPGNNSLDLIGTSDNQEVVDVSRQQMASAVDTSKHTGTGPVVFQIKGITAGTANVVFSTKPTNTVGSGQPVHTYTVQVK
ncbi:hypothetical protein [Spirosoma lituiforme]